MAHSRKRIQHSSPRIKSYLFGIVLLSVSTVTVVTAYSGNTPDDNNLWSQLLPESVLSKSDAKSQQKSTSEIAQAPGLIDPVPLTPLTAEAPLEPETLSDTKELNTPPTPSPENESESKVPEDSDPLGTYRVPDFNDPFESKRSKSLNTWYQMAAFEEEVPEITRIHAFFMDDDRVFSGRISIMGNGALVPKSVIFSQMGKEVREVPLGPDGQFSVSSLSPGPYGLHVNNDASMMVFGIYLATNSDLREAGYTEPGIQDALIAQPRSPIWLNSLASNPADYETVQRVLQDYRYDYPEETKLASTRRLLDIPAQLNFKATAQGTSIHDHMVRLHHDGTLYGRTRRFSTSTYNNKNAIVPAVQADISFIQDGRIVATTRSDSNGTFTTQDVIEGNYTLVAKSPAGIAVFSFTAKKARPVTAKEDVKTSSLDISDELQVVNFQNGEPETKIVQFVPGPDGTELLLDVTLVPPTQPPLAPVEGVGGAGGGFAGGGAAAGGGGLLGGLLLGGLAGTLLNDDDDPKPEEPEATPATP
jgi:hypothetical protein